MNERTSDPYASHHGRSVLERVTIIGSSGSGKTTLALTLSRLTGAVYLDTDAFHWLPDWQERPRDEYRALVAEGIAGPHWVTDGNYSSMREHVWNRSDTIIWLDYAMPVVLARLTQRTWRRLVFREPCCNGNTETVRNLLSRDSLYLWVLRTHYARKQRYRDLLTDAEASGKRVLLFRNPAQTRRWLNEVRALCAAEGSPC
ncbi:MAG: adenylate kinase [Armatimonadetes bacterium]|nr:adenylate kinase [Armatimonadota bacterium]MDE2206197.1 adenylate kinase [Armatimonadota bacterium]